MTDIFITTIACGKSVCDSAGDDPVGKAVFVVIVMAFMLIYAFVGEESDID